MQASVRQHTKLPELQLITHLWLNELQPFFSAGSRIYIEPLAHEALKDFYEFIDTSGTIHRFNLGVLIEPKIIRDQFVLIDIIHFFAALRKALRQSLMGYDPAETIMIMEYLDLWQEKIVSTYTTRIRQHNHRRTPYRRQLEQLKKLNDCVCALNTTLDTMSLLHATAQLAYILTDADLCIVFQKEGKLLFSKASAGRIGYNSKQIEIASPQTPETLVVDKYRQDVPLELARNNLGENRTQAMICTTIQTENTVLGKLTSVYLRPQRFTCCQVKSQEIFSRQVAQAICNAQLYESLGEQRATQERQRIACEMHDTVFQFLVTMNIKLKLALQSVEQEDWEHVKGLIEDARHLGKTAIAKGRETLNHLKEDCPVCESLLDSIQTDLSVFTEQSGITPNLIVTGDDLPEIPKPFRHHLKRLVGEALNNVFRHAQATVVTVRIKSTDDHLHIEIQDNGIGFETSSVDERSSFGLIGMRGRANLINAELGISSTLGQGTCISICAPLRCENFSLREYSE